MSHFSASRRPVQPERKLLFYTAKLKKLSEKIFIVKYKFVKKIQMRHRASEKTKCAQSDRRTIFCTF